MEQKRRLQVVVYDPSRPLGPQATKTWVEAFRQEDLDQILAVIQAASWNAKWGESNPKRSVIRIHTKHDPVTEAVVLISLIEHTIADQLTALVAADQH